VRLVSRSLQQALNEAPEDLSDLLAVLIESGEVFPIYDPARDEWCLYPAAKSEAKT
jgi:hypothetical protein